MTVREDVAAHEPRNRKSRRALLPWIRFAVALGVAVSLTPAGGQAQVLGHSTTVCSDGSKGAALVAQSPISMNQGNISTVLIFRNGPFAAAYLEELRYIAAPPKTSTLEAAQALQNHTARYLAAMNQVFSHARFAQPDQRGVILCGGLEPGEYEVLAIAQLAAVSAGSGTQTIRYYLARGAVPRSTGSRALIHAGAFVPL